MEHNYASIGICIGASTVTAVRLVSTRGHLKISTPVRIAHYGNPGGVLDSILQDGIPEHIAVTGRKYRKLLNFPSISEPEAIEHAIDYLKLQTDLVISAGGENFILYEIDRHGKISKAVTGNKCASGTGEFFLQQIKRMNLTADEAVELASGGTPYQISGRCSVFCKSDCTHALNKGVPKENVVAGLSDMTAQKITELASKIKFNNAILIGGLAKNKGVVRFLQENLAGVEVPEQAAYFEALGAAVYAITKKVTACDVPEQTNDKASSFAFHDDLKQHISKVTFKEAHHSTAEARDICILGLDVGSTTTKAVLLRKSDNAIIASAYLRTNGDPVSASVNCYKRIREQLSVPVKIKGLGVTGSGRHIAGMHALTQGVINEIIAHAAATVYYDPEVDTIFEIGGQDAKYTHLTAGVPSDYAMNEACSAGTGSFLEEAASETLGIDYKEIGDLALSASHPPDFNDQCSAFIGSDIKNALHEGFSKPDIVAGLVYSICLNYTNRVKGNRPTGKKIFMQGGVCYNKAVPIAMAALTGKDIIVPPDPGLMGAFGTALEIKKRIELHLMPEGDFDLDALINRQVTYEKEFVCAGGAEKCDRKCNVSIINIDNKKYPFGGACSKYYSISRTEPKRNDRGERNLVKYRQELVFEKYLAPSDKIRFTDGHNRKIGISKSFLTNTLYPLYYNFFTTLGFEIILGEEAKAEGIKKKESAFCYPVELAHGFFQDLIDKKPDYIFLPHILDIHNPGNTFYDRTCVLLQSEPYYLRTAFKIELSGIKLLSPVLSYSDGYTDAKKEFIEMAVEIGCNKKNATEAFDYALSQLKEMFTEFKSVGKKEIDDLNSGTDEFGIVLIGRAYNSFAKEANLGIPQKFASRGISIIPLDFLPAENYNSYDHMYWGTGNQILKAARFVKDHPNLYAVYITNFSCGPDSILINYFRTIMGNKPSLTLELDSHSADAGINTRIEAAIDIIRSYRELNEFSATIEPKEEFKLLKAVDAHTIKDASGNVFPITDKNIKVLVPGVGGLASEACSAAFRHIGINSEPVPLATMETLKIGRANTSCKECLPLILNAGAMMEYYHTKKPADEKTLFFMVQGTGPCRFGQYHVYMEDLMKRERLENIGIYSLTDEDSYGGLGNEFVKRGWAGVTTGDVYQNITHAVMALAKDKNAAKAILDEEWKKILVRIETGTLKELYSQLEISARRIAGIETTLNYKDAIKVALVGEIYVRHDSFSRMDLIERLQSRNIVVKVVPVGEYVYYSNYLARMADGTVQPSLREKIGFEIRDLIQVNIEKHIQRALTQSGFVEYELTDVAAVIKNAEHLIDTRLAGEAILTVGSGLKEIMTNVAGIISLGPFGCMPSRVAESILNTEMNTAGKLRAEGNKIVNAEESEALPFLAIETDGNIFPQIIESKIEIFTLQAERLNMKLKNAEVPEKSSYAAKFLDIVSGLLGKTSGIEYGEISTETE